MNVWKHTGGVALGKRNGAGLNFAAMWGELHWSRLSIVGVSMVGGVFHMVGQLAVVAFTFSPYVALVYLPVLMISGLVTGLLTGYVCRLVIRTTAKSNLFKSRARELARREGAAKRAAVPAPCAAPETDESNDQSETSESHV